MAEQDRERQLSEMQKRAESRCVPQSVQELEVATEPQEEETEEQSAMAEQTESSPSDAGHVSAPAASEATAPEPQGDQAAAAASTNSAEQWVTS